MKHSGLMSAAVSLLVAEASVAAAGATVRLVSHVSAAPAAKAGRAVALTVRLTDQGGPVAGGVVDLEIHDAHGKKVAQTFWQKQTLAPGRSAVYHWRWTPGARGVYAVKVGVFGPSWKPLYSWNDSALALKVF